jgi:hypothetical protein
MAPHATAYVDRRVDQFVASAGDAVPGEQALRTNCIEGVGTGRPIGRPSHFGVLRSRDDHFDAPK